MIDAFHSLFDDRSFIQIRSRTMRRCANPFNPAFVRLVIRFGAFEARKERGVKY